MLKPRDNLKNYYSVYKLNLKYNNELVNKLVPWWYIRVLSFAIVYHIPSNYQLNGNLIVFRDILYKLDLHLRTKKENERNYIQKEG